MKETPEEFLERITLTINSELEYRAILYKDMFDEDPDETLFPGLPFTPEDEEYVDSSFYEEGETGGRTRLDLPDNILNSWRADCPQFPYEVPCESCIYEHCNTHNYFIGGSAHGKEVSQYLTSQDVIGIPVPPPFDLVTSSPAVDFQTETYIKRTIGVVIREEERFYRAIAIWVLNSITDPQEAFQKFLRFAQRGE